MSDASLDLGRSAWDAVENVNDLGVDHRTFIPAIREELDKEFVSWLKYAAKKAEVTGAKIIIDEHGARLLSWDSKLITSGASLSGMVEHFDKEYP